MQAEVLQAFSLKLAAADVVRVPNGDAGPQVAFVPPDRGVQDIRNSNEELFGDLGIHGAGHDGLHAKNIGPAVPVD